MENICRERDFCFTMADYFDQAFFPFEFNYNNKTIKKMLLYEIILIYGKKISLNPQTQFENIFESNINKLIRDISKLFFIMRNM